MISPRPFGGRGVGGEGGSNRCRFSQSIPTFACPHPNPLPEGEGGPFWGRVLVWGFLSVCYVKERGIFPLIELSNGIVQYADKDRQV